MRERLSQIKENFRENLFSKWPATAVAILVVLGFSIGFIKRYLGTASVR